MKTVSRRDFLKTAVVTGIGAAVVPRFAVGDESASSKGVSRLVVSRNSGFSAEDKIVPDGLRTAVDSMIKSLSGKSSLDEAWKTVLTNYKDGDTISIKVNCINRFCPSHPELVYALTDSLKSAGIPENNIIIWDRSNRELRTSGYQLNESGEGVRCFGTDSEGWGYSDTTVNVEGREQRLSKILTDATDHLINVPVLKDHGLSGVTVSMKNHYGTVDNPRSLHDNNCDPFIAKLNAIPQIRDKTRLILLDAIFGIYKGGPGGKPQFTANTLAASVDPVAIDAFGLNMINEQRLANKLQSVTEKSKYIRTAASIGLGFNDEKQWEIISV